MKYRKNFWLAIVIAVSNFGILSIEANDKPFHVLNPEQFQALMGDEPDWISQNVPLLDSPDSQINEIYYFRWRVYKKHIKETPDGFIISEFTPDVPWAGKYNSISCAAGHHFYEGRWINNRKYLDDYGAFWFRKSGNPRLYSFWAADAYYARYLVNADQQWLTGLLPDLVKNFEAWEKSNQDENGLFWQEDGKDGMEVSIGGSGYRSTINSYMYGDAIAIAQIAGLSGEQSLAATYLDKAAKIKQLVHSKLWDNEAKFFKTLPREKEAKLVDVREEHGFVPWYFNLPDKGYETAWSQLMNPEGFFATFGPTTAERRHPRFNFKNDHDCLWNGPSWPYATTQTLVAMANVFNNYKQDVINKKDYFTVLKNYTRSQYKDGHPWIAEDLDGITGKWIVDKDRSFDYNHSAYCDLVISGLIGLRPRADNRIEIHPLIPEKTWDYFCLDGIPYHNHILTIFYDKTGERYHHGTGLQVWVDGKKTASSKNLASGISAVLPENNYSKTLTPHNESNAGWIKYAGSPVLGGDLGTCFDISVLKEKETYRMWFSWRPKKSIALVESTDGIHWSAPEIVLEPNPDTKWESDMNRPVVIKRGKTYSMWYTGQTDNHSWIGYAISPDGKTWTRQSKEPVISPDLPWEKAAVMCPHVIWDEQKKIYRMWYSGGEQYEPDAIGYAESPDGIQWTKWKNNPIFSADATNSWEQHKVTACQVLPYKNEYLMFYIGFRDVDHAQIGIARSKDGITGWQRLPANPILSPGEGQWDHDAVYKPSAIFDGKQWMLWYNGRRGNKEQIGLAIHDGLDLGFEK